jgi:hypothetical protein
VNVFDLLPIPQPRPGFFVVIYDDGEIEEFNEKPTIDRLHKLLECDTLDCVNLGDEKVMAVDDNGLLLQRPINLTGTAIYLTATGINSVIVGHVALIDDTDFE